MGMASPCLSFVYERYSPTNKKKTVNKKQKKNKQNNNKQKSTITCHGTCEHSHYRKSGNFCVKKFSCDNFSC